MFWTSASLRPTAKTLRRHAMCDVAASHITAVATALKPTVATAAVMDCYVPESISGHDGDLRKLHPEACGVPFSPETPGTRRGSRLRNGKRSALFSGTVDATARKSDRHILRVTCTDGVRAGSLSLVHHAGVTPHWHWRRHPARAAQISLHFPVSDSSCLI